MGQVAGAQPEGLSLFSHCFVNIYGKLSKNRGNGSRLFRLRFANRLCSSP